MVKQLVIVVLVTVIIIGSNVVDGQPQSPWWNPSNPIPIPSSPGGAFSGSPYRVPNPQPSSISQFIGEWDTHNSAMVCRSGPRCCCPSGPVTIKQGSGPDQLDVSAAVEGGAGCFFQKTLSGTFTQNSPTTASYTVSVPMLGNVRLSMSLDSTGNVLTITPSGSSCSTVGYRVGGPQSIQSPSSSQYCTPIPTQFGMITPYGCDSSNGVPYANNNNIPQSYPYSTVTANPPTSYDGNTNTQRYSDIASSLYGNNPASGFPSPFNGLGGAGGLASGLGGVGGIGGMMQGVTSGINSFETLVNSIGNLGSMASLVTPPSAPPAAAAAGIGARSAPSLRPISSISRPTPSVSSSSLSNGERLGRD